MVNNEKEEGSTKHSIKLTLCEAAYNIFVLQFRPKKQQFSVALSTP